MEHISSAQPTPEPGRSPLESSDIARHVAWLKGLAQSLVRDPGVADDAVQDTAMAALKTPPEGDEGTKRRWLGRVLRNRIKDATRRRQHRTDRERDHARPDEVEGVEDLALRAETGRDLAARVLALDEPMRSTLLLRFWDGLPPRAIAKRQGVPVATVKSRLARGLERIRRDLDESHGGDRSAWLAAVLPLARMKTPVATVAVAGSLALNAKLITTLAVAAVGGTFLLLRSPEGASDIEAATQGEAIQRRAMDLGPDGPGGGTQAPREQTTRRLATGPSAPASQPEAAPAILYPVSGRAVDGDARPVVGATIRVEDADAAGTTGARGEFTFETEEKTASLVAGSDEWVTVRPGSFRADGETDPLVVLAPAVDAAGVVLNRWGLPVAGAEIVLELPGDFLSRFEESLGASTRSGWSTQSDENGRFVIPRTAAVSGATLVATAIDHGPGEIPAPMTSRNDLRIELAQDAIAEGSVLRGRVVRADGRPASAARVALGTELRTVDPDGTFELDLERAGAAATLRAVEAGSMPGSVERPGMPRDERMGWPDTVEVVLGGAPLSISGTVVDEAGKGLPGARVWLHNPSEFGVLGIFPMRAEGLAAGLPVPEDAVRSLASVGVDQVDESHGSASNVTEPNAMLPWTTTDADGQFTLEGLSERAYTINVLGPTINYGMQSPDVEAGTTGHEIVIPGAGVIPEVNGRVVTRAGDGVPGVYVTPFLPAVSGDFPVLGGSANVMRYFLAPGVSTDDDGSFTLKDIPRAYVQFFVAGDGITPAYSSVSAIQDPASFEIEVAARIEASVQVNDLGLGVDRVTAIDFNDEPFGIVRLFADGYSTVGEVQLESGRTGVFAVTTDAKALRLMRGTEVIEEIPITSGPGVLFEVVR